MNYSYGAPPTVSSGALRSLTPDFPEDVQSKVVVAYATEAPAPTYSTGYIQSSDPHFPAVGQRALLADESVLPPPPETAVRTFEHSTNQLSGNGNSGWDETSGGGSISGFVHPNYSSNGNFDDYYSGGEGPGFSGLAQRDRSTNGPSTDDTTTDSLPNARHSMTGNKFKNAYKLFNQF
ncbi:hypothetical protein L2E82_11101 [Cichorium intybus]|uniref:Uncharacterized protein n=1 Tax=Cichorium intybus TaxID=13427 RepID=A0ACB9GDI5_CICIN|nr:hypothetical protein L2E82_11101 [Cichorium intybus]